MLRKALQNKKDVFDEAIYFLVKNKAKHLFEQVKVAMYLESSGYEDSLIIAGMLYKAKGDALKNFSEKIINLLDAVRENKEIKERFDRDKDLFKRCMAFGKDALILYSAILFIESEKYFLIEDANEKSYLLSRLKFFNNFSLELIRNEKVWKDLNTRYENLKSL